MFKISDWFKLIVCTVLSSGVATAGNFGQMNFAYWKIPPVSNPTVTYLVVAGGGSGGGYYVGGGGGAGGLLTGSTILTLGTTYTITVGAGGAITTGANTGANGNNSSLGSIAIAVGGGGGGYFFSPFTNTNGINGGSGGGAAYTGTTVGLGTSGQGNNGAPGNSAPNQGGGGGGAGSAGSNTSGTAYNIGPDGGSGIASSITGSTVYYAGGGGAGGDVWGGSGQAGGGNGGGGNTGGQGGSGGTVTGATSGTSGAANSGGGGGGAGGNVTTITGGAGGSGVVIISLPLAFGGTTYTGTPQITTTSTNIIYTFRSSGSITPATGTYSFSQTNPFADGSQIAYYPLNGNTTDSMGTYNGSVTGSLSYTSQGNPFNYSSPLFNGSTGYFASTSNSPFSGNNARSMFCWVKCNTVPQTGASGLVSTSITFGTGKQFTIDGSVAGSDTWSFWGYNVDLNSSIAPDTNWHFFGVTYDTSTINLYLDGSLIASLASTAINSVACPIYIGYSPYRPDAYMNSVRIFNRALTATEVTTLYIKGN
jgi:hypothetical protein